MSDIIQYVGARYVPLFADPIEWSESTTYDPLTIVTYMNSSYTSRKQVPVGIKPTNDEYWALTGNYNAQVEDYRQAVEEYQANVENLEYLKEFDNKKMLVIGDSNSVVGNSSLPSPRWVEKVNELCPNLSIDNNSIIGRLLCSKNVTGKVQSAVEYVDTLPSTIDYDYIVIFCGINDYFSMVNLGTVDNSVDKTNFNGALTNIFNSLISKCPKAQIIYISPLSTPKNSNAIYPLDCYRISSFNVCKKFCATGKQITYINGNSAPAYYQNGYTNTVYSLDGIHYANTYSEILAKYFLRKISSGGDTNVNAISHIIQIPVNDSVANSTNSYCFFSVNPDGSINLKIEAEIRQSGSTQNFIMDYTNELLGNDLQVAINIFSANGSISGSSIGNPLNLYCNTTSNNEMVGGNITFVSNALSSTSRTL